MTTKQGSWVSFYKLRIADFSNEVGLKAHDQHLLMTLALECSWEHHTYRGTIGDLANTMRSSRPAAASSMRRLEGEGVIHVLDPFKPNRVGEVVFVAYEHFIKKERKNGRRPGRLDTAPRSGKTVKTNVNRVQSDEEKGFDNWKFIRHLPAVAAEACASPSGIDVVALFFRTAFDENSFVRSASGANWTTPNSAQIKWCIGKGYVATFRYPLNDSVMTEGQVINWMRATFHTTPISEDLPSQHWTETLPPITPSSFL